VSSKLPDQIGRYRTGSVLGEGGFGVVVRAEDEALGDSVAIKILDSSWAVDTDIRQRFIEEARLLRRVRCDHLITVHDIGELDDGRPFFVMDLAERGTLADRIESRASTGVDNVSLQAIVDALADSLSALHTVGVVHRDVKPRNLLIETISSGTANVRGDVATAMRSGLIAHDERILLGDLGLAKDVEFSKAEHTIAAGTPRFRAPEQLDPRAEIGPATDVYGATAVLYAVMTGEPPIETMQPERMMGSLEDRWAPIIQRGLARNMHDRFSDIREWHAAVIKAIGSSDQDSSRAGLRYGADLCPYQGLAAFQPGDAGRFYGRDAMVRDLVSRLQTNRVLVIGGASGSGKSSLIRAGLIPAIKGGAYPDSDRWPVVLFTPGADPVKEMDYQLAKALDTIRGVSSSGGYSSADDSRWRRMTDQMSDATGGVLICIDQFEELFTFNHSQEVRDQFLDLLASIVDPAASRVRLILIIRADFYGASSRFPWLAKKITDNQVLVGPMSRVELREAIMEPARRAGLQLDDELIETVLAEGGATAGALPLVSHAMAETWRRRNGSRLSVDAYRGAGGVAGAIGQSAESLLADRFDNNERNAAKRLLLRMISPGDGVPDTRRPIAVSEIQADVEPEIMQGVAEGLVEARLLTIDGNVIQLAHEAIIASWPRLQEWISQSRDELRVHQRIERAAAEWEETDRNADLLYRGTSLAASMEWAQKHKQHLNRTELEFLEAGTQTEKAANKRSRRNRRLAFTALSGLTIAAIISTVIAYSALQRARDNEQAATQRLSQSLATQASDLVDENPRLALALAAEVIARSDTAPMEARMALVDATVGLVGAPYTPISSPHVVGDALTVTVHPSEDIVVTGNRDGTMQMWSVDGSPLGSAIKAHKGAIEELVFSTDGRQMLSAGVDGTVMDWDFSEPSFISPPRLLVDLKGILWSVAISPDKNKFATASEDGAVRLFDINRPDRPEVLFESELDLLAVKFSPDGKTLLASNGRGHIMGWGVADREVVIPKYNAHQSDVWDVEFYPDSSMFATGSSDGRIRLWDTKTGEKIAEPFAGVASDLRGVQIDANGILIAGDEQGRLHFWDIAQQKLLASSLAHHSSQITDSAVQTKGSLLVSLGQDQVVRSWRKTDEKPYRELLQLHAGAYGLAASPDGQWIAVGDGEGAVSMVDTQTSKPRFAPLRLSSNRIWAVDFSPDSALLAAADTKGALVIWDGDGNELSRHDSAHAGAITSLAFHPDKNVVFTGGSDGQVMQWEINSETNSLEPSGSAMGQHKGGVTKLQLSPDGSRLAVADRVGTIKIWLSATGKLEKEWVADDNTIWSLAWSDDAKSLATAHADEVLKIWNVESGEVLRELTPQPGGATDVAFMQDDMTLVSTSRDGTVRLWDRELGVQLGTVLGVEGAAQWQVAADNNAGWFVTSQADGSVKLWDLLDKASICRRAAWDKDAQRRYLGEGESPVSC